LLESSPITLTHAGINVPYDVYFNLALKLPVYSCTFSFCKYGSEFSESGNSTRLNGQSRNGGARHRRHAGYYRRQRLASLRSARGGGS